eukprot:CAMPEP_0177737368 /NCGR_PEP_ID=MMETSP0484_2-20121128/25847_1 /TAXON_ID=354590 /ORGANISM="Rhodomonas lens, Strain RHODO" /LENGTH=163 /DNA_ID=CAMNT_0019251143 /DNA_START=62 /DNA_END=550 /DNA_ORIENTATION=-
MRRCQVEGVSWIVLWACCFALQSSPHSPNAAFQNVHISAIDGTLVSWHENKILAPRTTLDLMLWRGLVPESGVSRLSSAAPCWNLRLRGGVILNKDADVIKEGKQLKMEKNRRKLEKWRERYALKQKEAAPAQRSEAVEQLAKVDTTPLAQELEEALTTARRQ